LVIGHWSLVIGHWSLVIGHWSLVIGHWSLVIGHWSFRQASCGLTRIGIRKTGAIDPAINLRHSEKTANFLRFASP